MSRKVFLDTNILLQDPLLGGAHSTKLLVGCKRLGVQVIAPHIVRDELDGNISRNVSKLCQNIESAIRELARLEIKPVAEKLDVNALQIKAKESVRAALTKFNIGFAAYPDVTARGLVLAEYENRKPFKSSGEGHKDFLVFETILAELAKNPGDIYFLTHNKKDFCDPHGGLHKDLESRVPPNCKALAFESANAFYEAVLAPELAKLAPLDDPATIRASIQGGTYLGFDLKDKLEQVLTKLVVEEGVDVDGLETPLNDTTVNSLQDIEVVDIQVGQLDENLINLDLVGSLTVELHGFMDKSEYYGSEDDLDVYVDDHDWNDRVVSAYSSTHTSFKLALVFDTQKHEIQSADVTVGEPG